MYAIMQINTQIRPWRNEEQKVDEERKRYYARMAVLQALISPWKKEGKKNKLLLHGIPEQGLTSLSGRNVFLVV